MARRGTLKSGGLGFYCGSVTYRLKQEWGLQLEIKLHYRGGACMWLNTILQRRDSCGLWQPTLPAAGGVHPQVKKM